MLVTDPIMCRRRVKLIWSLLEGDGCKLKCRSMSTDKTGVPFYKSGCIVIKRTEG